jgi:N-acetylglucosaminyldiphosphoundecaprenol N-acetyl-beta-D-mannosaminyltransferase
MDKKNSFEGKKSIGFDEALYLTYWKIFDISLFGRGMTEVLNIIKNWIESEARRKWIATVNPEFIMKALEEDGFRQILRQTDLNVVDGVGLIWAKELNKKFLISNFQFPKKIFYGLKVGGEILVGKHREGLVSGADLIPELCKLASKKGYKVFFLGGFGDRAKRTALYFSQKFKVESKKFNYCEGEPEVTNSEVMKKINSFKPDILFVAYGMKKQEEWIKNNIDKLDVGVVIGVGRSFDYYSGDLKRAPKLIRKMGMEWLYSLIKEPKRFRRQLVLPKFIWKVLTR